MWGNYDHRNPISPNVSCEILIKSNVFVGEHKPLEKHQKFEKTSILESDTDFQSFLLPLEQDFTKSSKGYASLLSTISNKEINGVNSTNKLNDSKVSNMLLTEKCSETDCLTNTNGRFLHINSSCICYNNFSDNTKNMYCKKYAEFSCETLQNIDDQNSKNIFSKDHKEITLDTLKSSLTDNVPGTDENMFLEKPETTNYPPRFSNFTEFIDKSDDENSSELFDTDSPYNGYSNTLSIDADSSSDDSVIFSENVVNKKNQGSVEVKQTFVSAINFDNSESSDADEDCLKMSEIRKYMFFSEGGIFEYGEVDLQKNPVTPQNSFCDLNIAFSSEGYVNACFEDDDILFENSGFLKSVNERWNDSMKDISEEPHESKKVSFVPLPNMVSVYSYEAEDDNYRYSLYVLDQQRFQNRIKDFEYIIAPYLTSEHRANVYQRNFL